MVTKEEKQKFAKYVKQQQWRAEGAVKTKPQSGKKESDWFGKKK